MAKAKLSKVIALSENICARHNRKNNQYTLMSLTNQSGIPEASLEEWKKVAHAILNFNPEKPSR